MPIIESLLDLDFYKPTMGQFIFHRYPDVDTTFGFKNRTTDVKLGQIIPIEDLSDELDYVADLRFQADELVYLSGLKTVEDKPYFKEDFLEFLSELKLGGYDLGVKKDGQLDLSFTGRWHTKTYWETISLSIVNELYYKQIVPDLSEAEAEGNRRLDRKIEILKQHPGIRIMEFGTRRRFSGAWQEHVLRRLLSEIPSQVTGTSNVKLAMKLGIPPRGTMAHELFMVIAALLSVTRTTLRMSHNIVLQQWWDEYGEPLSVALTDTFGTDFFFKDMTAEQAIKWLGLRHDSGPAEIFGEKAEAFYRKFNIDPKTKQLVFSDGLDIDDIVDLWTRFGETFKVVVMGWGTNLTNDLGFGALSLIVKAIIAMGKMTVKLSDNLAKAQGPEEEIGLYKEVFGHTVTSFEKTVY